jgi:hypothetical protein
MLRELSRTGIWTEMMPMTWVEDHGMAKSADRITYE